MDDSLTTINRLLQEVAGHLTSSAKSERSAAVDKLNRISAIASTLAFTVKLRR